MKHLNLHGWKLSIFPAGSLYRQVAGRSPCRRWLRREMKSLRRFWWRDPGRAVTGGYSWDDFDVFVFNMEILCPCSMYVVFTYMFSGQMLVNIPAPWNIWDGILCFCWNIWVKYCVFGMGYCVFVGTYGLNIVFLGWDIVFLLEHMG